MVHGNGPSSSVSSRELHLRFIRSCGGIEGSNGGPASRWACGCRSSAANSGEACFLGDDTWHRVGTGCDSLRCFRLRRRLPSLLCRPGQRLCLGGQCVLAKTLLQQPRHSSRLPLYLVRARHTATSGGVCWPCGCGGQRLGQCNAGRSVGLPRGCGAAKGAGGSSCNQLRQHSICG